MPAAQRPIAVQPAPVSMLDISMHMRSTRTRFVHSASRSRAEYAEAWLTRFSDAERRTLAGEEAILPQLRCFVQMLTEKRVHNRCCDPSS